MGFDAIFALIVFVVASGAAASSGTIFKPGDWYEGLKHPSWRPPNWIFPLVWTPLYAMIAASGFIAWQAVGWSGGAAAFAVFFVQLALNFCWSWVFFGQKRPDRALAELALLWLSILVNILVFWPISALAGWLLVPYFIWVSFAGYLNYTLWRLNPGETGATTAG
ncbi:MAG: TspO/MBR family protein [Pseudomonadota bacterium]